MARLACRCLNVNVFAAKSDWRSNPVPTSKLFSNQSQFRDEVVYEVNLDVAGIVTELGMLVCTTRVGDWIVHSCSICQTDVYITHVVKGDRTFVLPEVLSGDEAIHNVCAQKDYSSIFKVLLTSVQDDGNGDILRRKRVSSMTFGREDPDMKLIHQKMKSYLKSEELAMEERIRIFEEEQRLAFSSLQENAHRQRSVLFTAIAKAREKNEFKEVKHTVAVPVDASPEIYTAKAEISEEVKKKPIQKSATQKVTITIQDKAGLSLVKEDNPHEDSLFTLEGFDEQPYMGSPDVTGVGDVAFPQSDDEDNSTNDSSFRDVSSLTGINLATSVPVGIPLFKHSTGTSISSDDHAGSEVADVGSSIHQLALSVQDTGMFGDLPRPRMMTNPFS